MVFSYIWSLGFLGAFKTIIINLISNYKNTVLLVVIESILREKFVMFTLEINIKFVFVASLRSLANRFFCARFENLVLSLALYER